jgi:uncharacterized repeat protein (TIGR04076 family)
VADRADAFRLYDLEIVVERIEGRCTCRMRVGDRMRLRGGKVSLPAGRDFCLYALQAAIPLLPAKQRAEPAAIRDSVRRVLDPKGTVVHAGAAEFRKARGLIKEGKPIRYVGVIGPVQFDRYGDITGPFRMWRIQNGEVKTVGEISAAEVDQLKARMGE